MPIVHMVTKPEDALEGAVNLRDVSEQWKSHYSGEGKFNLWVYDTHQGLCLHERECNMHDDSDFYMTVWNPETKQPQEIQFGTTRGWSYPTLGSHVDATPAVQAEYETWLAEKRREAEAARAAELARAPGRGKTLKVVKGRKVPKGTVGVCIWVGNGTWGERVGIKDSQGTVHWTAMSNVEVVQRQAA